MLFFLSLIGLKTLREKEKMLVTSIFSFSRNVFSKTYLLRVIWSRDCAVKGQAMFCKKAFYSICKSMHADMDKNCLLSVKILYQED